MTPEESRKVGSRQVMKGALILFALYEFSMLVSHTNGDIANGVIFFIASQANPIFLAVTAMYFFTMYVTGRAAGHRILIKNEAPKKIAFLFAVLTTILVCAYIATAISFISDDAIQRQDFPRIMQTLAFSFIILLVALLCVWFWAVRRLKRISAKAQ